MRKNVIYKVDAFASTLFSGNPAAVCPLKQWLSDEQMQAIAAENNLSETAFIVPIGNDYEIRWFMPNVEVDLCGHATLASAYVLFECLGKKTNAIIFHSRSGDLKVKKLNHLLEMDFPALPFNQISAAAELLNTVNVKPKEIYQSTFDLMMIFDKENDVRQAEVDLAAISKLANRGIILSAPGNSSDIYSRCFYPFGGAPEDPVTGSAHCAIIPYWSNRLGKQKLHARQGLKRQGELWGEIKNDRVLLAGECQLYLEGQIFLPD